MGDQTLPTISRSAVIPQYCRDCLSDLGHEFSAEQPLQRCSVCGSPRVTAHAELNDLSFAHIDCDAFYASVEKRDDPSLADKPVIIGGGHRGVVSTCCYVARLYGVRSAMPMFKALTLCPDAVVIRPQMEKYSRVGRDVRDLMKEATPLVEPISIDEAFLDLTGTEPVHGCPPALTLMRLAYRIEQEIGVTVSVGLSYNKFLAKVASDLQKPRGFAIIGKADARDFLETKPVEIIWGVGKSLKKKLNSDGLLTVGDLRRLTALDLVRRYGSIGQRLHSFAHGEDSRAVTPERETKSVSAETTLSVDVADVKHILDILWPLCERVAARMEKSAITGRTAILKLKDTDFVSLTRNKRLTAPTRSPELLYRAVEPLVRKEVATDAERAFRLIGVGLSDIIEDGEQQRDLLALAEGGESDDRPRFAFADQGRSSSTPAGASLAHSNSQSRIRKSDKALSAVQGKLGFDSISRGRSFKLQKKNKHS